MPSLVGETVAANYLKAAASSQFGTRHLEVIKVAIASVQTNYANANSLFSKSVRAMQQTAEVYAVFTPVYDESDHANDYFHAIIATDTQWDGTSAAQGTTGGAAGDGTYNVFETAIALGNGGTTATVTKPAGFVAARA
jgi:hypothetical protein